MPFTSNRDFKANPRLLVSAEGVYFKDDDGNAILDGTAGLWCVPCGHAQPRIVAAVREMIASLISRRPSRWATLPRSTSRKN